MPFSPEPLIRRLESFAQALPAAVAGITPEEARFKPPSGAWSILEVVCHLVDEETEDFRARIAFILEGKPGEWPPIDPEAAARDRRYNEQDFHGAVSRFIAERRQSVRWLRSLAAPDWNRAYQHPRFGPVHAGILMASWPAHDALHLRQIAKRLFELAGRDGAPYKTDYAGEWKA